MAASEQIIGIDKVVAALGGWSVAAKQAIADAMTGGVNTGRDTAFALSPVLIGYLQSRNQMNVVGWTTETRFEVELLNDAPYALFVNGGTRFMAAQPFFSQGVEAASTDITKRLKALK